MEKLDIKYNFANKTILITGAGSGIGKELSIQLDKVGAKLLLIDISNELLENLKSILSSEDHTYISFDLSKLKEIENLIRELSCNNNKIDGFVHCVGIRSRRPISMIKPDYLNNIMTINFSSFIEIVRCITKRGRYNKQLSIIGISSVASLRGGSSITAYAASKSAIDGAIRCLAKELARKSIRVNSVCPSQINTPAYEEFLLASNSEDFTLRRQYLGLGEAIDVVNSIMFLLSSASKFISGIALPVDGGYLNS